MRALAIAGLLLGAGCAAATAPGTVDAGSRALLDAWLIPEAEEIGSPPPSRSATNRNLGGGPLGPVDELDLVDPDGFIVLEGIPEPHEPTAISVSVTAVRTLTLDGTAFVAVHVAGETPGRERIAGLFPLEPVPATAPVATGRGPVGLWVTGAPFANWSDGRSHRGEGVWHTVAEGATGDHGTSCAGPTADAGAPHTYPTCLALHLGDDSARHSPVYGFAADGYPVHGPWADLELPARSSWRLRNYDSPEAATGCSQPGRRTCLLLDPLDPAAGTRPAPAAGPDTAEAPPGTFFEDYWFDIALDDGSPHALDAFNGHIHDDLGYHYHITRIQNGDGSFTDVFPYILGPWFRGEPHRGAVNAGGPRLADTAGTAAPRELDEHAEMPQPSPDEHPGCALRRLQVCD